MLFFLLIFSCLSHSFLTCRIYLFFHLLFIFFSHLFFLFFFNQKIDLRPLNNSSSCFTPYYYNHHYRNFYPFFPQKIDLRPINKVILLAGPPGTGKTTLAHIIASHCGYRAYEVNASDDRSAEVKVLLLFLLYSLYSTFHQFSVLFSVVFCFYNSFPFSLEVL